MCFLIRAGTHGTVWKGGFLSCGGRPDLNNGSSVSKECFHIPIGGNTGSQVQYPDMLVPRTDLASAIYQGRLWLIGGRIGSQGNIFTMFEIVSQFCEKRGYYFFNIFLLGPFLDSTEIIGSDNQWTFGPTLPGSLYFHAACPTLSEDSNTRYLICGGTFNGLQTNKAYLYDWSTDAWSNLPDMLENAIYHSCSPFKVNDGASDIVVVNLGTVSKKVQFLDLSSLTWSSGPDLPVRRFINQQLTVVGRLFLIGGHDGTNGLTDTLELSTDGLTWSPSDPGMTLTVANDFFLAIPYNI